MRILGTNEYINEKLNIRPVTRTRLSGLVIYTHHPSTVTELADIIEERINEKGYRCNLNDIDVSAITNMSDLFRMSDNLKLFRNYPF